MTFLDTFMKAQKLVDSKQNRENAIALIGLDTEGNESFLQWLKPSDKVASLNISSSITKVRALAGTIG